MKILVAVKQIETLEEDFSLSEDGKRVDPDYVDRELNEWDEYAYETALQIMEAGDGVEIIPVTVGPEEAEDALRKCLAKGGERGIRVWDDALENSAPNVIGRIIARVAEKEEANMVFAGTLASDHAFAQTGISVAAELKWAHAAVVSKLDYTPGDSPVTLKRELEEGLEEEMTLELPAVLTIQLGINKPRYASLRGIKQAKSKPIDLLSHTDIGLSDEEVGETGSSFRIRRLFVPEKEQAELIEGTPAEQAQRLAEIIREMTEQAS